MRNESYSLILGCEGCENYSICDEEIAGDCAVEFHNEEMATANLDLDLFDIDDAHEAHEEHMRDIREDCLNEPDPCHHCRSINRSHGCNDGCCPSLKY